LISAIVKYNLTERARQVMQDAMDGARRLQRWPWARAIPSAPTTASAAGRTVEGHNILTGNAHHLRPGGDPLSSLPAAGTAGGVGTDEKAPGASSNKC